MVRKQRGSIWYCRLLWLCHLLHVSSWGASIVACHQKGRRLKHWRLNVNMRVILIALLSTLWIQIFLQSKHRLNELFVLQRVLREIIVDLLDYIVKKVLVVLLLKVANIEKHGIGIVQGMDGWHLMALVLRPRWHGIMKSDLRVCRSLGLVLNQLESSLVVNRAGLHYFALTLLSVDNQVSSKFSSSHGILSRQYSWRIFFPFLWTSFSLVVWQDIGTSCCKFSSWIKWLSLLLKWIESCLIINLLLPLRERLYHIRLGWPLWGHYHLIIQPTGTWLLLIWRLNRLALLIGSMLFLLVLKLRRIRHIHALLMLLYSYWTK